MRLLLPLWLILAVACSKHGQHPVPQDNLPEVNAKLDPPPEGEKIKLDRFRGEVFIGTSNAGPTLLAAEPDVTYATLMDEAMRLARGNYLLLVHTPHGVGALPLPLPKAETGALDDEPTLVLAVGRSSTGAPQLFVGPTPVAEAELERALRDSHRKRLALNVDNATLVGDYARILAIAYAVTPDVRTIVSPKPPIEVPAPR